MDSERPAFLGDNWLLPPQGYSYVADPPADVYDEKSLQSNNQWLRFLFIFERAKTGDWMHLAVLPDIIRRSGDLELSGAALDLLGCAGSVTLLTELVSFFSHPEFDTRLDAYTAAARSCSLTVVQPLLAARREHLSTERGMIENSLSKLLEPRASTICEPRGLSDSAYEMLVKRTVSDIEANAGRGMPVFRGQVLDLAFLLERIREITLDPQVQEYSGTLFDYLHRFEAMTGTPCRHLFDDEDNALPLSIQAALEMFIKLGGLSRFRRGQRYFFGHPIG